MRVRFPPAPPHTRDFFRYWRKMDQFGKCPNCGSDWSAGTIFAALRPQAWCADKTDAELQAYIEAHYSPPYEFSRVIGIEIQGEDRVSRWRCPDCNKEWRRH